MEIFDEVAVYELDHRNFIQWNWVLDFEADGIRGPLMFLLCLVVKEKKRKCDFKVVIFWVVFEFFVFWYIHLVCS